MAHTPYQRTVDALLRTKGHDEGLDEFVLSRRREGKSWRAIATDLRDATDGGTEVPETSLHNWYREVAA